MPELNESKPGSYRRSPLQRKLAAAGLAIAVSFVWTLAPSLAYADPPPWAPAHGYDKNGKGKGKHKGKNKDKHRVKQQDTYVAPFDLNIGTCNRALLGSVLGGAVGGAAGTQVGKGSGKTAAIIGGTIVGYMIGGAIGRYMDQIDQNCIGQSLEHSPDGRSIEWENPNDSGRYAVTPTKTFQRSSGGYCREYTTTSIIGGKSQSVYGTACRQPDGAWKLVN